MQLVSDDWCWSILPLSTYSLQLGWKSLLSLWVYSSSFHHCQFLGGGQVLQITEKALDHHADRTQMCLGLLPFTGSWGLSGHLPPSEEEWDHRPEGKRDKIGGAWLQPINLSLQPQLELEGLDLMVMEGFREICLAVWLRVCSPWVCTILLFCWRFVSQLFWCFLVCVTAIAGKLWPPSPCTDVSHPSKE